jgi:hypothetical protein
MYKLCKFLAGFFNSLAEASFENRPLYFRHIHWIKFAYGMSPYGNTIANVDSQGYTYYPRPEDDKWYWVWYWDGSKRVPELKMFISSSDIY